MARHFAEIGLDGVVSRVILADSIDFCLSAFPGRWFIETFNPNEDVPGFERTTRPTYAGIGMRYDWLTDDFVPGGG